MRDNLQRTKRDYFTNATATVIFWGAEQIIQCGIIENPGAVISASINKYSFISARYLPPFFDYKHRIRYYQNEEVNSIDQIKHPSVRECAKLLGIDKGLEIVHTADLPAPFRIRFEFGIHCWNAERIIIITK